MITTNERENLISEIMSLLDEYDYSYTRKGIEVNIDTWAENKAPWIEAFKKHPNYIEGKFMIAFDCDYVREVDPSITYSFKQWLLHSCIFPEQFPVPTEISGDTYGMDERFYWWLLDFLPMPNRVIDEIEEEGLNKYLPCLHAHEGQKKTRIVNKLCQYLGYDKHPDYNREFAKYADALSPIVIKRHTILSINPLDYLTMSFGNSWASCHTIDKENIRNMPDHYHGQYSSGTISYMLDGVSMVLYTVNANYNGNEYWTQPKINRQMFHCGEEKIIQGRLYPQSCDGQNDIYQPYRILVQEIISSILDIPNLWTLRRGIDAAREYINTEGTHYPDYENYSSCTLSRLKNSTNENNITVGHSPICIECGCEHDREENINCCNTVICYNCGEEINREDAHEIDGEYYCSSCCERCDSCGQYVRSSTTYVGAYTYVCDDCLEKYYARCDECGDYVEIDSTYTTVDGNDICPDCYERYYERCAECGDLYPLDELNDDMLCYDCANKEVE